MALSLRKHLAAVTAACGISALGGLWPSGCVDEPLAVICQPGDTCSCPANETCLIECPGGGCDLKCPPDGRCGFDCTDGGCTVSCEAAPTCDLNCEGGGCEMSCVDGSDCKLYFCEDCDLECGGSLACTHDD